MTSLAIIFLLAVVVHVLLAVQNDRVNADWSATSVAISNIICLLIGIALSITVIA